MEDANPLWGASRIHGELLKLGIESPNGFSSHCHFAAAFRRAFGCTPSAFRESTRSARPKCVV
jgi:hypothetical protein